MNRLIVFKKERQLSLLNGESSKIFSCPIGLGFSPYGPKTQEGDGKTPEGTYFICLKRETGKYGVALGISYPNEKDAKKALNCEFISISEWESIRSACLEGRRPPWGTKLGGEIYLHGGGASDWTAGCIALNDEDMKKLFPLVEERDEVQILP